LGVHERPLGPKKKIPRTLRRHLGPHEKKGPGRPRGQNPKLGKKFGPKGCKRAGIVAIQNKEPMKTKVNAKVSGTGGPLFLREKGNNGIKRNNPGQRDRNL